MKIDTAKIVNEPADFFEIQIPKFGACDHFNSSI